MILSHLCLPIPPLGRAVEYGRSDAIRQPQVQRIVHEGYFAAPEGALYVLVSTAKVGTCPSLNHRSDPSSLKT